MSLIVAVELAVSAKQWTGRSVVKEAVFMWQCRRLSGEAGCSLNAQSGRRSQPAS
jgi:hypothetical protein